MSAPHRWSLLVPVAGLLVAIALLPAAAGSLVPDSFRELLSYLVVWVPLGVSVALSVRLVGRQRAEAWWSTLRLPLDITGVSVGVFVGLATRTVGVGAELMTSGRIGGGMPFFGCGSSAPSATLWLIVASVVVAPAIEEAYFRGTLLPAVTERIRWGQAGVWSAIVFVASIFAAVHALVGAAPLTTIVTFVAGVGFGFVSRSYGIGSAIVAHAVFNVSGIALAVSSADVSSVCTTLTLG